MAQTNALLKSIGGGVNLDMATMVERQVRGMLERLKTEVRRATQQTGQGFAQLTEGAKQSATQIEQLVSATQKMSADGSVTLTQKGYDKLNQSITEVYKNAQLATRTLTTDSALTKDIAYANQLYAEQITYLKRVYDLKTQRLNTPEGSSKAAELDKQIAETGALADANKEIIALLDSQAVSRSKLVNLGNEETRIAQKFAIAQAQVQDRASGQASSGVREIMQAQGAYQRLTEAYRQYDAAVKSGNNAGQAYWQQSIAGAMREMQAIEGKLDSLSLEEGARRRLLDLIQKAKDAEATHTQALSGTNQLVDQMGKRLTQMLVTAVALRTLSSIWREAIGFAREYYDLLNEIRVVSGKTQAQADEMGKRYRKFARDMQVSATEVAKAAVEYFRQGLREDEVNRRVNATVKFAKVAA